MLDCSELPRRSPGCYRRRFATKLRFPFGWISAYNFETRFDVGQDHSQNSSPSGMHVNEHEAPNRYSRRHICLDVRVEIGILGRLAPTVGPLARSCSGGIDQSEASLASMPPRDDNRF